MGTRALGFLKVFSRGDFPLSQWEVVEMWRSDILRGKNEHFLAWCYWYEGTFAMIDRCVAAKEGKWWKLHCSRSPQIHASPPKKSITRFRLPFLFAHRSQTVICIAAVGQKQQRFCDLLPILWPTKMAVSSKYWHCPITICHHRKDGCNVLNDPHRSICHQLSWFKVIEETHDVEVLIQHTQKCHWHS